MLNPEMPNAVPPQEDETDPITEAVAESEVEVGEDDEVKPLDLESTGESKTEPVDEEPMDEAA